MNQGTTRSRSGIRNKAATIRELFGYLRTKGGWLLIPLVTLIAIIAILVILAQTTGLGSFFYPL